MLAHRAMKKTISKAYSILVIQKTRIARVDV